MVKLISKYLENYGEIPMKKIKTMTKSTQELYHKLYTQYRDQNISPEDCSRYALRELKLPENLCIDEYTIIEDEK